MRQFICPLLILGLAPTAGTSAQSCSTFAECDQLARAARDKGDLYTAQAHYQTACFTPVVEALLNLRNNACLAVTAISSKLDNYASAYSFFNKACNDGADAGCFHLALLENDRGNAQRAMEIMQPLCDRQYVVHKNVCSSGCNEYRQMKQAWEVKNKRQPRAEVVQITLAAVTLLLPLAAAVSLFFRRYFVSFVLSASAFIVYAYYEYGVSPYASIRIDLLLIYPLLLLSLIVLTFSTALIFRKRFG